MNRRRWLVAGLLGILLAGTVEAQSADGGREPSKESARGGRDSSKAAPEPRATYALWTTSATRQPLATRFGSRHDRGLYLLGLQRSWPLGPNPSGGMTWFYSVDLLPLVVSTGMPAYFDQFGPCDERLSCLERATTSELHTAYAFGAMPLGLIARVPTTRRLDLQFRMSGGAMYFSRPVPDPAGRRFNFVAEAGAGIEYRVGADVALTGGMRINHISNGNTGHVNPGMNSLMTEIGVRR
jgi:hypothetical protein